MKLTEPAPFAVTVASSFIAGFLLALALCHEPAKASDDGLLQHDPNERTPAAVDGKPGCNPYIVIHPPDLPPDASNLNGVTITLNIGDVCGQWQAKPQVVPSLPLPKA